MKGVLIFVILFLSTLFNLRGQGYLFVGDDFSTKDSLAVVTSGSEYHVLEITLSNPEFIKRVPLHSLSNIDTLYINTLPIDKYIEEGLLLRFKDIKAITFVAFTTIPDEVFECSKIESMSVIGDIRKVPTGISRLINIRELTIEHLGPKELEVSSLSKLKNLEYLYIKAKKLKNTEELLISISDLPIKSLCLCSSDMFFSPSLLGNLNQIESLRIEKVKKVNPDSITKYASGLSELKEFGLSSCGLKEIPDFVFAMENLQVLRLGNNMIKQLSPDISKLDNLEELYIGGNNIEELPIEIVQMKNLKKIRVPYDSCKKLRKSESYKEIKRMMPWCLFVESSNYTYGPPNVQRL